LQNFKDQVEPKYRIGAIAKMSGVAIATLRVWQRRYGLVQPQKSSGGQRLFDDDDLSKLKCIKDLIDLGFAIGTLAHLSLSELTALKVKTLTKRGFLQSNDFGATPLRICLIGVGLQERLIDLERLSDIDVPKFKIDQVFSNLDEAFGRLQRLDSDSGSGVDACIVKLSTLQMQNIQPIQALQERMKGACLGVIYNYANPEVLSLLQSMQVALLRHPFDNKELIEFMKLWVVSSANARDSELLPPYVRRFSAQDLQFITSFQSSVGCECPKHIAQIIEQLGSFEQYSRECLSLNVKDQKLHKMLTRVATQTLGMFERALQDVMTHERIELPLRHNRP
jgi:hypothetical protein